MMSCGLLIGSVVFPIVPVGFVEMRLARCCLESINWCPSVLPVFDWARPGPGTTFEGSVLMESVGLVGISCRFSLCSLLVYPVGKCTIAVVVMSSTEMSRSESEVLKFADASRLRNLTSSSEKGLLSGLFGVLVSLLIVVLRRCGIC